MQASYSLFFVELGISFQPLKESYSKYEFLTTHLWKKMLWGKISMFGLDIIVADFALEYPREGSRFIMQVLFEMGYPRDMLLRLNQVHFSLQILFLSDILTASGHKINHDVLLHWPPDEEWSTNRWPNKRPTKSDSHLWR
jgi:hypothetical protein